MDSITLEIYRSLYTSVAEEMGVSLRRTAFSPNIKERRDYSCAVFDRRGRIIAQGDHMPVHLGSMPMSVKAAIEHCAMQPGDVVILNDPYAGGTHLPDVTMVAPVFSEASQLLFYVANRAHHADIGGATPGSMGAATEIYQEGIRIPPLRIVRGGQLEQEVWNFLLANVRGRDEREGDFAAQLGALRVGSDRLHEIVARYGFKEADAYAGHLVEYAARLMRRTLALLPDGVYEAEDFLDNDGEIDEPVRITVKVTIRGERARIDFTGSAPQVRGPVNAVEAITVSAAYYVFRCLIPGDVPASAGILEPLEVIAPAGTIVNALPPAPVAGGNVETSQRIVDVLLKALAQAAPHLIPAASQGTMNNLTIGGWDARLGREFAYYETVCGGMGARPNADGISAVHTHMTNSLNTPIEALEYAYPLRVRRYAIRRGSGGAGKQRGGDGTIREIELLADAQVSLLADRRKFAPYGLQGGAPGKVGIAELIEAHGGKRKKLPSKFSLKARCGDRLVIETPGGGGHGAREA
ncbi:MAG: hydantoinase B/oxoprolinase family protein [Acidobacteria bacterium]|nr:hydantoinase B/oxoprolinase family protein [Acidobacteriota bacterium]MBI3424865.1 hydantoinase B/oxoprolinase family protein [Acidobacteriota bacterium]